MIRKIQYTGNATYIISLPKEWVRLNKLKEKDPVKIEFSKNKVIIRPIEIEHAKLLIPGKLTSLKKEIIASYVEGYEKILIKGSELSDRDLEKVMRFIDEYLKGVAITIQNKDILINSIINYETLDILELFENFFVSVFRNFEKLINIKAIKIDDSLIDKEALFIKKICMENIAVPKIQVLSERSLVNIYALTNILENIMDSLIDYAGSKKRIHKKHLKELLHYLKEIYESYKQRNINKLSEISDKLRKKRNKISIELKELTRLEIDLAEELIDLIEGMKS